MSEIITPEEQAVLDEMQYQPIVRIPPSDQTKLRLYKGMVYKNLISFMVDFDKKEYGFIRRDLDSTYVQS